MKKQPHFIKKIITAVFCLLLIVTAFIPGIELISERSSSGSLGSNTTTKTVAGKISPSQLINAGNASDEEIKEAEKALATKTSEVMKDLADGKYNSETAAIDVIKNSEESGNYYALLIRNTENLIPESADSSSANKDFVGSSKLYSIVTIAFYVLVAALLALLITQLFISNKALTIITRILAVFVLVGALASTLMVLPMEIYTESSSAYYSMRSVSRCGITLAGPLAVILAIPTMILGLCSMKKKK